MRVKETPLSDIRPYPGNPRRNDQAVQAVANSLREFGWKQPIVVDADGTIIAGHTRYKAAQALGMNEVPVVVASDLTPEQVYAYRLADNKTAELAEWDADLLAVELDGLASVDMSAFGFCADDFGIASDDHGFDVPDIAAEEIDLDEATSAADHVFWAFSGGRDSTLALLATYDTFRRQGKTCQVIHVSGGCEFPDIEVHVRKVCRSIGADLVVLRPRRNFLTEYAERGEFPNPLFMDCVDKLINKPMNDFIDSQVGDAKFILVRGGKASQKTARSNTDRLQRVKSRPNMTIYNPAFDYTEEQLSAEIPEWRGYAEGFLRTACWCCPFQRKQQWDALKRCYPLLWEELREMFGTVAFKRIEGDSHQRNVERYWRGEHGVDVKWF